MPGFVAISREFTGELLVPAAIEVAFPLFSPEGERAWVPGWSPELVHPPGVTWAQGQIFRTKEEKGDAFWLVNLLDLSGHTVEYHRVEPQRYVARVRMECNAEDQRQTRVRVTYEFIGLTSEGNDEIRAMTGQAYQEKMARWKKWIDEYLRRR